MYVLQLSWNYYNFAQDFCFDDKPGNLWTVWILRVRISQSNFRSELSAFLNPTEHSGLQTIFFVLIHWAQQISAGPWYVRVVKLSIWSAHKEQLTAKTALKLFRKYQYLLILHEIQTIQRFFILLSKLKLNIQSFLEFLSCTKIMNNLVKDPKILSFKVTFNFLK